MDADSVVSIDTVVLFARDRYAVALGLGSWIGGAAVERLLDHLMSL